MRVTGSDSFSATLRCHDANREVCSLGLSRTRVTLSSYEADAIRTTVEAWADTVPALALGMDPIGIGNGSVVGFLVVGILRRLGVWPARGW